MVEDCGVAVAAVALPPVAACDGVAAEAPRGDGDCCDEFDARVNKDADAAAKPRMGDTAEAKTHILKDHNQGNLDWHGYQSWFSCPQEGVDFQN